jgi:membrane protein YqaA with SNARE-associated domain
MTTALRKQTLNLAAFAWCVAEATLFFIVPDVLLSFIGLRRGARPALVACLAAALGAAAGGVLMYLWSASDPAAAHAAVLAVPAISADMGQAARDAMQTQGWFPATIEGPLSRTPYKLYAVLAPEAGAPLWLFAAASILARLPRFLVISLGCVLIARIGAPRFGMATLTWALSLGWVLFYVAFFALTPG